MTLEREKRDAWIPQSFTGYFPTSDFNAAKLTYSLLKLPEEGSSVLSETTLRTCEHARLSTECADLLLLRTHPDALDANHIFKLWVFPYGQLRVGFAEIAGVSE